MTDEQIKHMVQRFLMWRLPEDFRPDGGISATRPNCGPGVAWEPSGTNLLDARQAEAMVRHMLEGMPTPANLNAPDKQEALAEGVERRAAEAIRSAFFTSVSGEKPHRYHLSLAYPTMEAMHAAEDAIKAWAVAVLEGPARTLPSNEALAGDDRNGAEGLVEQAIAGVGKRWSGYASCLAYARAVGREVAISALSPAGGEQVGWTIEHGPVERPVYLTAGMSWTKHRGSALHFARQVDADDMIEANGWEDFRVAALTKPAALPKEGEEYEVWHTLTAMLVDVPMYDGDDPRALHYQRQRRALEYALSSLPVRSGEVERLRTGSAPIGSIMDPINPEEEAELLAAGAPDTWTAARQARRQTYLYCADVAGSVYVRDLEAHFRKCAEQVPGSSAALAPPPQAQVE